ncbi:MAG: alpha/beta hydrolase [Flavobacteriaceae bacterium]
MTDITKPPACFDPANIPADTAACGREIVARLTAAADMWSVAPQTVRDLRAAGKGTFPLPPRSPRAETLRIDGPHGPVALRVIAPDNPRGAFLHIHGGGWVLGAADQQDDRLERLAGNCGLAVVSVEYRLAPEFPYPQGPDDCEAAALWLVGEGARHFATSKFFIGGESAGAHLSVVAMLRLRDRHGLTPFAGANLVAGCYDLAMTPSVRNWGDEKLVLCTRDIENFVGRFLCAGGDTADPDISPIHADLRGLPPAFFTVGTSDLLLDDSLFMHQRWLAAGNDAELAVYPGGMHVFTGFPELDQAQDALARAEAFIGGLL